MDSPSSALVFFVNGTKVVEDSAQPEWTLLFYLRNRLRLTGTKLGCGEGGCGACTVMISRCDRPSNNIMHYAVNACLTPVCAVHGLAVTTVEGIGQSPSEDDAGQGQPRRRRRLHAVQERLAKAHGSQCGFCTPGFVMSMYALLRSGKEQLPTMAQVEEGFQGNLCRCTGYRPILEGCRTLTRDGCCGGNKVNGSGCCMDVQPEAPRQNGHANGDLNGSTIKRAVCTTLTPAEFEVSYSDSQEPIFPPELQLNDDLDKQFIAIKGERVTWYRPTSLNQLLQLKSDYPVAKLVVGNTEVALEMKFKHCDYPVLIHPVLIPELVDFKINRDGVLFGGAVNLTAFKSVLEHEVKMKPESETRLFKALVEMLHWFAGKQIRNVAAIAGNIMTGSPISDLNPLFMAFRCELTLQSKAKGIRKVKMDDNFFTGYRKNIVLSDEILLSISIPKTTADEYVKAYKQSRRREDDIAIVNGAFRVRFRPGTCIIEEAAFVFGGMAPTTVMALETSQMLIGRRWEESNLVEDVCQKLLEDLPLPPSVPGGMSSYRQSLCLSFFFKFHLHVLNELAKREIIKNAPFGKYEELEMAGRASFKSAQLFELVPNSQPELDPIGRPIAHLSGEKHTTGEAIYCDDMPPVANELHMALVLSTHAHADIVSIDESAALALDGVRGFFSSKDVLPGRNHFGAIIHDEEVFASSRVTCCGQIIGCVVADTLAIAQRASRLVKVTYKPVDGPIIITIQDAIKHDSLFHDHARSIVKGDVETALAGAQHTLQGTFEMAGQEHFYLETHAVLVVPKGEDGELDIICSTQNQAEVQLLVSEVLDLPANRVVCRVKRMGGGFGGKETRAVVVALPAAVAASKLQRPVRCMLDRDEDMMITGTRHPFFANYKVGFDSTGRLLALDVQLYANGGNSMDLSRGIMERANFHIENSYRIEHLRCRGWVCRTNLPSNTAFRGFGAPQGMAVCENVLAQVASHLQTDVETIRELNLYTEGDSTHFNQQLERCTLDKCWAECRAMAGGFEERRRSVDAYNKTHRYKKRGLAMVPTKFGIAFTALFLNQSGALIHVYRDGSVLLSHGGTEMGQGLHTKMIQVASRALGVPVELIHISEASTDKVPNTSPTAASAGSDLNGMAVLNACEILVERLAPIRKANPSGTWNEWINQAYFQRISLSTTGFYKTPDPLGYDFATGIGTPFRYFTFGAACSEVEIDCLTGNHKVLRTDIVMDLGESLNPAIDIGQIEGGFVQGLGLFTLEEPLFSPATGQVMTRGPSTYKIPTADDIPEEFNVSLLRGCPNPHAVYSSKAVGEPPLFLASSVFFAIRDAIAAARKEVGLTGFFKLDSPATAERIRMACEDDITRQVPKHEPGTFQPWAVSI